MSGLIVAGGTPPSYKLITAELTANPTIIAVDSGANCLWEYQITPDYLIGDFDSITPQVLQFWQDKNIPCDTYPTAKNFTDTQLALQKAHTLKLKKLVFLGALGGNRIDHLLGTLGLLATCAQWGISACLKDEHQIITLLEHSTIIHGNNQQLFSLQAYGAPVTNLTITGSKYELTNYQLAMGDTRTISNEFLAQPVTIKFTSGRLLLNKIS